MTIGFVGMRSGKTMPVDPIPDPLGTVVAHTDELGIWKDGHIVPADQPAPKGYTRFMTHYGTCARMRTPHVIPEPSIPGPWPPEDDQPTLL